MKTRNFRNKGRELTDQVAGSEDDNPVKRTEGDANSTSQWDLEVEVAKVIEKGVALGIITKREGSALDREKNHTEEQVSKGGDFNTVMDQSERIGEGCDMGSIRRFSSFVHQMGTIDIPLQGSRFTWSNNRTKAA
ncbi:hypothetical protein Dsin_031751 [Dipteronia sinensis]|uniref:Uncharacterized protein n=1 Tax=Dipteronia sinensis TaxID=43782 RepID=A0AAD9ZM59_9ROSI|nr:hypothetical protein Dsin_031751 [Dipteronia sinensis]